MASSLKATPNCVRWKPTPPGFTSLARARGLKDIPSSVAQGSAAAAKAISLLAREQLETNPQVAKVDIKRCVGCMKCVSRLPLWRYQGNGLQRTTQGGSFSTPFCQGLRHLFRGLPAERDSAAAFQ